MSLAPGTRIGVYKITAAIGVGGMGEVYRATDTRLKRQVAIKILPNAVGADPDRLARFHREAELLASLNHPNIAAIYGFEDAAATHALVMELVDGPTLADRVAGGPVPLSEAVSIAKQIADALQAAHEQHIVHRDLKPANIKVKNDGTVKMLDFGLAKALDPSMTAKGSRTGSAEGLSATLTSPALVTGRGIILGTAAYMSPEQARGHVIDQRTDVWAFGVILFEMLTGTRPFHGETVSDTILAVLDREPDWRALPDSIPATVTRVLKQCLQKDVKLRRRDIGDIQLDLQDGLTSGQLAGMSAGGSVVRSWRSVPLAYGAIALVLGAAIAGSGLYAMRPAAAVPDPIELSILPPAGTTFPMELGAPWPSVSPDGRQLAFVAVSASGIQQLWIRALDSASPHVVEHTEGAARPFWSADGRAIGFFADGKIKRVDVPNGTSQVVCDAPYLGGMSASWGSQGTIVFTELGGVFRVPASGGTPQLVLGDEQKGSGSVARHNPSFLPDGRRFVFVERRPNREDQLCVGSLDETSPTCVANLASPARYAPPGYLLYARDGVLRLQRFSPDRLTFAGESMPVSSTYVQVFPVYRPPPFSISDRTLAYHPGTKKSRLTWVDRRGHIVSVVSEGSDNEASVSRDGSRIVVSRGDQQHPGNVNLWLRSSSSQTWSRFTFGSADSSPLLSPDGMRVAYTTQRDGSANLFIKPTSGLLPEQRLLHFPPGVDGSPEDWSSDGRWILYHAISPATSWDIWKIPADGSGAPEVVLNGPGGERNGTLSPDMKWIAYDSTDSGRREIWMQPMPPNGNRWQVSTDGGIYPRWRGDGRELFYLRADGRLVAVVVTPGPTPIIGAVTPLFQTLMREGAAGFRVSSDGQQFLITGPPDLAETDPITVIVNWSRAIRF